MKLHIVITAALALFVGTAAAQDTPASTTLEMQVDGLVCAFCAQGIEKKLRKQAATDEVFVSLEHHLVAVALKPGQDLGDETLRALLADAGYTLRDVKRTSEPLAAVRARVASP